MSDLLLVIGVGVITYASRVALLAKHRPVPKGGIGRFLDVFPLALFVAIAATGLLAPEGDPAVTPGLAAAAGGIIGAALFRRSLVGILSLGAAVFHLTRLVIS